MSLRETPGSLRSYKEANLVIYFRTCLRLSVILIEMRMPSKHVPTTSERTNFPSDCLDFDGDEIRSIVLVNEKGIFEFSSRPKTKGWHYSVVVAITATLLGRHCRRCRKRIKFRRNFWGRKLGLNAIAVQPVKVMWINTNTKKELQWLIQMVIYDIETNNLVGKSSCHSTKLNLRSFEKYLQRNLVAFVGVTCNAEFWTCASERNPVCQWCVCCDDLCVRTMAI